MLTLDKFLILLPSKAESRVDRAILLLAYMKAFGGVTAMPLRDLGTLFERAHLAKPSVSVLQNMLTTDKRVSVRAGVARCLHAGDTYFREVCPEAHAESADVTTLSAEQVNFLGATPFVDGQYIADLQKMLDLYAAVHVLENSMRRLIEKILQDEYGQDWWNRCASSPQKQKHTDRLEKERTRKWLPARSTLGPLYSLDWSDLITLIRKYEVLFTPFLGEINFLHRFADMGLLRHVIAHNGFIDDPNEMQRVRLALRDWQKQLS